MYHTPLLSITRGAR